MRMLFKKAEQEQAAYEHATLVKDIAKSVLIELRSRYGR